MRRYIYEPGDRQSIWDVVWIRRVTVVFFRRSYRAPVGDEFAFSDFSQSDKSDGESSDSDEDDAALPASASSSPSAEDPDGEGSSAAPKAGAYAWHPCCPNIKLTITVHS